MARWVAFGLTLVAAMGVAFAQGTLRDYQNADRFGQRFAGKVLNESLQTVWIEGEPRFTYCQHLPGGRKQFWLVDAAEGTKELAFDHERLARLLSKELDQEVDPERFPFDRVRMFAGGQIMLVQMGGPRFIDLTTYEITTGGDDDRDGLEAFAPEELTRSGGGGEQTSIRFVNQSDKQLRVFWLQDDGTPREYKLLEPGEVWQINTWETHYWLVTTEDREALAVYKPSLDGGTAYLDGERVPYHQEPQPPVGQSPDGKSRITFSNSQAVFHETGADGSTMLTTDGSVDNRYVGPVYWSPNSRRAVFRQMVPEERRPLNIVITTPRDQFQPRLQTGQYLKPGDRVAQYTVCVYDLDTKEVTKVSTEHYANHFALDAYQWLDSDRFIFRTNERGHQAMKVIEYNAAGGRHRVLIDERAETFIDWTQKSLFRVLEGDEAIWQSERSGWSHVYRYDLKTGEVLNPITSGDWVFRRMDTLNEEEGWMTFYASGLDPDEDPYHMHYCRVNLDGTGFTRLTGGDGNHRLSISPDGEFFIATYSRVDLPPVHELRRVSDGGLVMELERADATELLEAGFPMPRRFVAKGRDGETDIWGIIHLPSNFDPERKYPVIEDIYAGPHGSHVPKNFHTNSGAMQMAELGFIVVRIDGMGTSNRNKAFHDVCWQNIADAGFPDRKLWIEAAAEEIPAMDLSRVGIYGTSAGAQNALHALLLHGDFYHVAVADCGCYDNRMDKIWWNEQWMGYPVGPHYEEQSGRTLAKNLEGKLMLLLGEVDTNVDPASTYQVIDALIEADKDFDFVVIPNVGHGAAGHPYGRRRMRDFFVRHLLGVEPRLD